MVHLHLDLESRSQVDLRAFGLDRYARDRSTRILMMAWAVDDAPVRLWLPHEQPKPPAELREAVHDPTVTKLAWNAAFEAAMFEHVLKARVRNFRDVMVHAHYLSMPGSLAEVGRIVGLPEDQQKIAEGKRLIKRFCVPRKPTAKKPWIFADWNTDPEAWDRFCGYGIRDVETERAIHKRLSAYPMPEREWRLWHLDQRINAAGLPVDLQFVEHAIAIARQEQQRLVRELRHLTGLAVPTNVTAFLGWAKAHGYPFGDLRKEQVARALTDDAISPELRLGLEMRRDASKTSVAKFEVLRDLHVNGRLRHALQFYGAHRTGRWAARKVQTHNLTTPAKAVQARLDHATDLIRRGDLPAIEADFESPMQVLSSCVRSAFRAPPGKHFVIADLNAIENRVLGWLARCDAILDVFRQGRDPYLDFGTALFNRPYEDLLAEYLAGNKELRSKPKPAVLGAGFRLGGGELRVNPKTGDFKKTGLWGYAESLGIQLTQEEAHHAVAVFRQRFPEVVRFWYDLEDAARRAVEERLTTRLGALTIRYVPGALCIDLPAGRSLYYLRPRVRTMVFQGRDGEPYAKRVLTYEGQNSVTKQWGRLTTHGGKLAENVTQAVARDVLAEGLVRADRAGFPLVGHVHDEAIAEVEDGSPLDVPTLCQCLSAPIAWAPGLPLAAAGFEAAFYRKE